MLGHIALLTKTPCIQYAAECVAAAGSCKDPAHYVHGGNMRPPLRDAKHNLMQGGKQQPDFGPENHSIAMHKSIRQSSSCPTGPAVALLVPAAALALAASQGIMHGAVCHGSAPKGGGCAASK